MIEFCVTIEYYGNNRGNIKKVRPTANFATDKGVKLCRIWRTHNFLR